jgi:hypothetical protein
MKGMGLRALLCVWRGGHAGRQRATAVCVELLNGSFNTEIVESTEVRKRGREG